MHTFPPLEIRLLASTSRSFCLVCNSFCETTPLYSTNGLKRFDIYNGQVEDTTHTNKKSASIFY